MTALACPVCGLRYTLPVDRKEHDRYHAAYLEVTAALDYTPMHPDEWEAAKARGQEMISQGQLLDGLLLKIRAWYDRSLTFAIGQGYGHLHPTLEQYAAMLDQGPAGGLSGAEAWQLVRARYGHTPGIIPRGSTYWDPPRQ